MNTIPRIPKSLLKKILIIGGIAKRNLPNWANVFLHYPQDKFCKSIPKNIEYVIVVADFTSHTKIEYIKKFFGALNLFEVNGGKNKIAECLLKIINSHKEEDNKQFNYEEYFYTNENNTESL